MYSAQLTLRRRRYLALTGALLTLASVALFASPPAQSAQISNQPEPGQLAIQDKDGRIGNLCPLKGTTVNADIAGFGARVTVVQKFVNPTKSAIEAIYTFPLPADAAVDRMRMKIGSRIIEGTIRRSEEARRIYDAAKNAGQSAALLDQDRPNIFTQSVANITPGSEVEIEISYVQILKFEAGEFEFNFPMVVGPRFLGNAPDPNKISPPITPPKTRTGANISINVHLDAGAPINDVQSVLHRVDINRDGDRIADIKLSKRDEIPNRDFILKYRTATDSVQSAFVTSYDGKKGGFFSLVLLPPKAPKPTQISPREMFFVMDQSGSQGGLPIDKSKELTLKLIKTLRPGDTFNIFGFNSTVRALYPSSRPVNSETIAEAQAFVKGMDANGGTQLLEGLNAALTPPNDPHRLRIVVFNTDGFVGDEPQILDRIVKSRGIARIFTFGIGNSVNRFLIDTMSLEGQGDSAIVTLNAEADKVVDQFIQRTRTPVLTHPTAKFEGIEVNEVMPQTIPDVFSETPIVIHGRYENPGQGKVILTGLVGGRPWSKTVNLRFSSDPGHSEIQSLWARKKIDQVQSTSYLSMLHANPVDKVAEKITDIALEFGLMSQYTSFVAVESKVVNVGGKQVSVRVPVEMADGVLYESEALDSGRTTKRMSAAGGSFASVNMKSVNVASAPLIKDVTLHQEAETPETRYQRIVAKELKMAKGKVMVTLWMASISDETLVKLKKLGFTASTVDKNLRVIFGTCNAEQLRKLSEITIIQRIEAIKDK